MRLKPFIIFLVIFTIIYILFFILIDYIASSKAKKRLEEKMNKVLNVNEYYKFINFYGMQSTITNELLTSFYNDVKKSTGIIISAYKQKYNLSLYEIVVLMLYFEYYNIIPRYNINVKEELVTTADSNDRQLMFRYESLFLEKKNYNEIVEKYGVMAPKDLAYIDERCLVPGVRIINQVIYYYEGGIV